MTSYIDFIKFKNILLDNHIDLFDHDLRISHHRLCNLLKNKEQHGGSSVSRNNICEKLNNMSQIHLSHLINSLLVKNEQKSTWILNIN